MNSGIESIHPSSAAPATGAPGFECSEKPGPAHRAAGRRCAGLVAAAGLFLGSMVAAQAQGVTVNGATSTILEALILVSWNCNQAIPPGDYWVQVDSGAWGYAGGPEQGRMRCHPSNTAGDHSAPAPVVRSSAKSECEAKYPYWEDRMAYCYGLSD